MTSKSGKNCFWRKTLSSTWPKQSAKKKKRPQKHLAFSEHHVRLAKQARYKLKLETQHQVSHCTNQVVDAEINAAAKHHVEAKEAFISKIEEDHHQENGLKVAIDPDQETEAEEAATGVETRTRGPVQQSTRSARIVRRWVTTREPAELVNPSLPHQPSQHRWQNETKLHW